MAITASFIPSSGVLSVFGDSLDNTITLSRNAAGQILINGGAISVVGGQPTVANTTLMQVFGQAGNDSITLDETNGALPAANLFGGAGNDTMTGGSGSDQLFGQAGNDILLGKGGNDFLFGGDDNDTLTGGTGDDQVFGQAGNDRMIWNPGDGTDLFEGGDGTDTAEVNGGNGAETFTVTANGTRVRFDRITPAPFSLDIGTTEELVVNANGGDDIITAGNGLATLIHLTLDGGSGNDTITGGDGSDTLLGGDGNDLVAGGRGSDTALLGAGDDTFVWNPGDGNDTVDGQDGTDKLLFNGANINEIVNLSANGTHARFTRDIANITMDLDNIEQVQFNALGGADQITVGNLVTTDVKQVTIELGAPDGAADQVVVTGTNGVDVITVAGAGISVVVTGLPAQVNVNGIEAANDRLVINAASGNDTINAGGVPAGVIGLTLDGGAGNDTIVGSQGNDTILGGDQNDTLTGGVGDDAMLGQAGNDRMIWNPGDGTDLFEGGDGTDTAEVNGGNGAETFTVTANGTRVRFDRITPAPFSLDIGTTEELVVNANGGDDIITAGNGLATLIHLTLDGGSGNDTITGGDGSDTLLGGDGNDLVAGGRGSDTALLGAGDDTFVWNPGDGNDTVDGQDGTDKLLFNGANINEIVNLSANGTHARFTRDIANITMDLDNIEQVQFNALGGADQITVGNLVTTDVKQVTIELGAPDGAADQVVVTGTNGVDVITVAGAGISVVVTGLPAQVNVNGIEAANDRLVINAASGNDTINAGGVPAGVIGLTLDGGAGNDTIVGSQGNDTILGGDQNDIVSGGLGNDLALLGTGNDTFIWNPGDGSDIVEGQAGTDTLLFDGSDAAENINVLANGARALFQRDIANIAMDLNGVEIVDFNALGGTDIVFVGDLTGTGVTQVNVNLSAVAGGSSGDGAADSVALVGTEGGDAIKVASSGAKVVVSGLAARVTVSGSEGANDSLTINGQGGDDTINASTLIAGRVKLTINGGLGNDTIDGSRGDDLVNGGSGNDTARLGLGNDTFVWNPGDGSDTVDGQSGLDTLLFNGANINENIGISATGGHATFTRNVANITMDLDNVETIDFQARGGADNITVNDLSKTDVRNVKLDLGGLDGQVDTVVVDGTNGNDRITIRNDSGVITVSGLHAAVTITGFESTDRLVINGLDGNDAITIVGDLGMGLSAGSSNIPSLLGQYMASSFVPGSQGPSSSPVTEAAANQPALLALPHA